MHKFIERYQVIIFFALSTILGYGPLLITGKPIWFIYGMPISGFLVTLIIYGWKGIIQQLQSIFRIKAPIIEYLKIFLILLCINVITLILSFILFHDIPSFKMIMNEPLLIPALLLVILIGGPIIEEAFGLRGYALPQLLKKYSPLVSSVIVGFYFGAWHYVEFIRPGSTQYAIGLTYYPLFIIAEISVSILMTYFYLRNNNNLFLAGIYFHWMMNSIAILFQTDLTYSGIQYAPKMNTHYFVIYSIILFIFSLIIVIRGKMHLKKTFI